MTVIMLLNIGVSWRYSPQNKQIQ